MIKIDWLANLIFGFLGNELLKLVEYTKAAINNMFTAIVLINDNQYVSAASKYAQALAMSLLVMLALKKIVMTYGLQTDGDPDQDPFELLFRGTMAMAIISSANILFKEGLKFADAVSNDLLKTSSITDVSSGLTALFQTDLEKAAVSFTIGAITLVLIICFHISATIRGAELMLMKIMMPLFACDLINTNAQRWNTFLPDLISTLMSYGLQLFCYFMFTYNFGNISVTNLNSASIAAFGWMILAIRTPKWLEKYIYKSGVGAAVAKSGQTAAQAAVMMA